jgi:hypothetical protein
MILADKEVFSGFDIENTPTFAALNMARARLFA